MPEVEAKRSSSRGLRLLKAEGVRLAGPAVTNALVRLPGQPQGAGGHTTPRVPSAAAEPGLEPALAGSLPAVQKAAAGRRLFRVKDGRALRSAKARAEALLAAAREQAEALARQARQEGFQAGYREGLDRGRQEGLREVSEALRSLLERLQQTVEEALRRRDEALGRAEDDVVSLALAVAEKITRQKVESGPEVTLAVLRSLLDAGQLPGPAGRLEVHLNPREFELLRDAGPDLLHVAGPIQVEWVSDPHVAPGGCVVESDMGSIDASLETRLASVREALLDGVYHGRRP